MNSVTLVSCTSITQIQDLISHCNINMNRAEALQGMLITDASQALQASANPQQVKVIKTSL